MICNYIIKEPNETESGRRTYIFGVYSKDFPEHPPTSGIVRASTYSHGYVVEEFEDEKGTYCNVKFEIETDMKISQFVFRNLAPKASNYPFFIKKYMHKKKGIPLWELKVKKLFKDYTEL